MYSGTMFITPTSKAFPTALQASILAEKSISLFTFGRVIRSSMPSNLKKVSNCSEGMLFKYFRSLPGLVEIKSTKYQIEFSFPTGGKIKSKVLFRSSGKNEFSERILASVRERLKGLSLKSPSI